MKKKGSEDSLYSGKNLPGGNLPGCLLDHLLKPSTVKLCGCWTSECVQAWQELDVRMYCACAKPDVRLLNSPHPQPHEQQDFQAAAPPGGMHQNCTHYFGTCVCTNLRPVQHAGNASCSALFSPLAAADLQDVTTASKAVGILCLSARQTPHPPAGR
ncbi:hypothetical protein Bbelb_184150 [Branchiostoma belcheri]|nr:hypothetical protein Bbelb_184150 [Branchiostoma belcheri]